jgi:hypothetical protein
MEVQITGYVEGRSANVAPEKAINLFYEKTAGGDALVNTPGSTEFADIGVAAEVRGGIVFGDEAYFIVGNSLYRVLQDGVSTLIGTINTVRGRVSMAHNGTRPGANQQLMIVDGYDGWIYDKTADTLTQIIDADFEDASSVVFIDGYFIYSRVGSDADQRELYIFGTESLEVWYNAGDADNPFQRYQGGFKQTGTIAPETVARFDNNIAWLTKNERGGLEVSIMGKNYLPQMISSQELSYQMSKYSTVDDAFAYSYQYEGHEFYVLNFPTEGRVWAYDARTQQWHQRGHTINKVFPSRERYNCHVYAYGKHLLGDFSNGKLYELDASVATVNGTRVPRVVTTPNITDEEQRLRISSAQLDMEEGTGDPNVSTDTSIWLSYSKDGGHTYSEEISASIGDAGEYRKRVIWRRLGWGRNWTFRVRTWSPNRVILKGLYLRRYGE